MLLNACEQTFQLKAREDDDAITTIYTTLGHNYEAVNVAQR